MWARMKEELFYFNNSFDVFSIKNTSFLTSSFVYSLVRLEMLYSILHKISWGLLLEDRESNEKGLYLN